MIVVPFQEILKEKIERQGMVKDIESHANGHSIHIGQISSGCRKCFTGEQGSGIQIGTQCMYKCPYCYYDVNRREQSRQDMDRMLADFFYMSLDPSWKPTIFSYQSAGETLLYADELEKFALILDQTERRSGVHQYRYMYTNGVLADEAMLIRMRDNMGVDEIRFHLSASNFSKVAYKNMELAAKMGFIITVEEPSWPLHREELFELLPILDRIGAKHLDMVEVQINENNRDNIEKHYPGNSARAFKDFYYHLYDEGLVYDIMDEVKAKGYKFSVLDCSSAVERCRHNNDQHVLFNWKTLDGMCSPWKY